MRKLTKKTVDRFAGIIAIILGAIALSETVKLYPYSKTPLSGDHVFPFLIGMIFILAGAVLAIVGDKSSKESQNEKQEAALDKKTLILIIALPIVLLIYIQLLPLVGYLTATGIVSIVLFKWIGGFRWWVSVLAAIVLAISLHFIFVEWLYTPLPSGKWTIWEGL